ncbi:hypothetical protein GN244_ATG08171 [Phytophthora infestans]|uniref:Secreted RxLR effector peptide protein n=1 Tax=Phytophthora infestans TaxID=4787 RepID=A0A833SSH8_PHYIN|nr:hypothetical protein GN244_ATG08171 [Phytophthora infestans]
MLAALLRLIWIVSVLTPLNAIEEGDTVLCREIIHRLSQHLCRLSELLDQTTFDAARRHLGSAGEAAYSRTRVDTGRSGGRAMEALENEVVLSESTRRHRLALFRNGPEAFDESDTVFRGKKRVKRQPMTRDDDMRMSDDDVQMRDWQGDMGVQELSIVAVLVALSKDMVKHDFETPKSTILGNNWILNELAALDRAIHT